MPHDCTDWTKSPPCRKAPYFLLRHGDDYIYTIVPDDLDALRDIARKEFRLGDANFRITSACGNLWNGEPARITDSAWALVSACIGCATVEILDHPPAALVAEREPEPPVDHAIDHDRARTPPQEDEVEQGPSSPRKARYQRRIESDDDEPEARDASAQALVAPPPERVDANQEQQNDRTDQHDEPAPMPLPDATQSVTDKPIKQEKPDAATFPRADSQPETVVAPTEPTENQKLMIRVAHRPTKQESKFTAKSTTKVHKVLSGVCKSFGLDVNSATLYLIVSTADEHGEEENLFPCDIHDSIARAGAEHDTESRFLLKIAGEP